MNVSDLKPGEVFVSAPERVEVHDAPDGSPLSYAVMRRHFVGFCVHEDGSCKEGSDIGPAGDRAARLEAYSEWPCRDSFASDEEYEKVARTHKSSAEHARGFFQEFDDHNQRRA